MMLSGEFGPDEVKGASVVGLAPLLFIITHPVILHRQDRSLWDDIYMKVFWKASGDKPNAKSLAQRISINKMSVGPVLC